MIEAGNMIGIEWHEPEVKCDAGLAKFRILATIKCKLVAGMMKPGKMFRDNLEWFAVVVHAESLSWWVLLPVGEVIQFE